MRIINVLKFNHYNPVFHGGVIDTLAFFEEEYHDGELKEKVLPLIEKYLSNNGYYIAADCSIEDIFLKNELAIYQPQYCTWGWMYLDEYELNTLLEVYAR